jgi:DNA-binding winged helix-turn-helix (wHTH) protein
LQRKSPFRRRLAHLWSSISSAFATRPSIGKICSNAKLCISAEALDILIYLAERPGEVIAKQELLDRVWSDVTVEEGSIRVHVFAIRKALGDGQFGNRYIANIKGRGLLVRRHLRSSRRQCGEQEPSSTRGSGIMTTALRTELRSNRPNRSGTN